VPKLEVESLNEESLSWQVKFLNQSVVNQVLSQLEVRVRLIRIRSQEKSFQAGYFPKETLGCSHISCNYLSPPRIDIHRLRRSRPNNNYYTYLQVRQVSILVKACSPNTHHKIDTASARYIQSLAKKSSLTIF